MSSTSHEAQRELPSVAPHSEQNFPVAGAPHAGQVELDADGSAVEVIRQSYTPDVGFPTAQAGMLAACLGNMPTPNLITIDLDSREGTSGRSSDVAPLVGSLLGVLERAKTSATFFASREVAETQGSLLRDVVTTGHEVACLSTTSAVGRTPYCATFARELRATKAAVEDATGRRARGHRISGFGIDYASEWTYDVLVENGFEYDSSRLPTRYVEYGYAVVPRSVHAIRRWGGTLLEVPVSTADILAMRVQVGTTATVRGLPLMVWKQVVSERQNAGESIVMHLRTSELRRPRSFTLKGSSDQIVDDKRTIDRVSGFVAPFAFTSVAKALPELMRSAPVIEL